MSNERAATALAGVEGGLQMARQQRTKQAQQGAMSGQEDIHELRQRAHDAGIEGNSKMTEQQLRQALTKVGKGEDPMMAKQEAKGM
jgi:hypothetical protein